MRPSRSTPANSVSFDLSLHLPDAIEGDTVTDRACINWEDMPADHDADLPNDCAEVITPVPQPQIDLAMEKTGPAECAPGGECDYTMLIHNNGPDDFATPLTVTDVVPDGATLLGWFPPIWNCGQPGGAGGDVTCTLPAGLTVPAHGVIGLLIGLTLPDDIAGDAVTDRACVDWDAMPADGDADPGNDCADIDTPIHVPQIDLQMQKSGPPTCLPGHLCLYNMIITNNGPDDLGPPLAITDTVPAGAVLDSSAPDAWHCVQPGGAGTDVTCTFGAPLAAHASATMGIWLRLPDAIDSETITDRACIDWGAMPADGDANADNDCAEVITDVPPLIILEGFDLGIEKTAPAACEMPAGCDFTVTVTNYGPDDYTGPIVVHDELPAPGAFSALGPWTCESAGLPHINCTHPAMTLGADDSVSLTIHWTPSAQVAGRVDNCVDIHWDGMAADGDSNAGNDHACASTEIPVLISIADLAISTTGPPSCERGSACPVSVTLVNAGSPVVTARLSVTGTTSPAVPISNVTALGDPGWSCSVSGSGYECHHNPLTLRPKDTQRFQATLQIPAAFAGSSVTHRVDLGWIDGQGDSNRANDSASVTIPILDPQCPRDRLERPDLRLPERLDGRPGLRHAAPTCTGGRIWNGQECVCRSELTGAAGPACRAAVAGGDGMARPASA